jgi:hypothetical protein
LLRDIKIGADLIGRTRADLCSAEGGAAERAEGRA